MPTTTPNDATIEIIIIPIVGGNFKNLKLIQPNTAVRTKIMEIRLYTYNSRKNIEKDQINL